MKQILSKSKLFVFELTTFKEAFSNDFSPLESVPEHSIFKSSIISSSLTASI